MAVGGLGLLTLGWWLLIPPRNDRDWQPDVARRPTIEFRGDVVTVHNVRNFDYRTETDFHVQQAAVHNPWNWRLLVNGRADELLYHRGTIDTSLPFPRVRARSDVTAKAKAVDRDPDFSQRVRAGLPPRPGMPC